MQLKIKNFRAIKEQTLDLAPITVIYGPNGAGKSSLLYSLLTLKNVILNSNQASNGFFNYVFASLGSFEAVVFDHHPTSNIDLSISTDRDGLTVQQGVSFNEKQGVLKLSAHGDDNFKFSTELAVTFPYAGNQQATSAVSYKDSGFNLTWNGITTLIPADAQNTPETLQIGSRLVSALNAPAEVLRKTTIIPLKRGFSKPFYQTQPLSSLLINEDEVATFISQDKYLISRVSFYLEKILERDFRVNFQPGTAIFSLDATDKKTGIATELVNEGFGVNQMVYFLAKTLSKDVEWSCVEEPEIHLHPSAVRKFARALSDMVLEETKRFLVSTHSEAFVTALLSMVAEGRLKPEQVAFYLVRKDGRRARYEHQIVDSHGQIEGGLASFMEGEIQDLKSFLGVGK
jgi:energy-coupling factor transporter ATP-binding protein EcfA2